MKNVLLSVLAIALMAGVASATVYDAAADWEQGLGYEFGGQYYPNATSTPPPANWGQWSAGWGGSPTDGVFNAMGQLWNVADEDNRQLFGNTPGFGGTVYVQPAVWHSYVGGGYNVDGQLEGDISFLPGVNWAYAGNTPKLRWTSDIDGTADITVRWAQGYLTPAAPGNTAAAYIVKNGVILSTSEYFADLTDPDDPDIWGSPMYGRTVNLNIPIAVGDVIDFAVGTIGEANANIRARYITIDAVPEPMTLGLLGLGGLLIRRRRTR